MSHQVIGLANAVVDMCFRVEAFPIRPSEHQLMHNRFITPGGMANTLLAGARLGLKMKAVGNIGNDDFAQLWRRHMLAEGIDIGDQIVCEDQPTSLAIALSDAAGEHLFLGSRGNFIMAPGQFPESWRKSIHETDALFLYGWSYLSLGPDTNLEAIKTAQAANVPIFFDPGPEIPHMPPAWLEANLAGATVVLLTYDEAQMIIQEPLPPEEMAERIRQMGAELVILKLGAEGLIGHTVLETIHEPGIQVPVVDLTGAGDSVAAAVFLAYLDEYPLAKLLQLANAAGAACVQKFGAGLNVPTLAEITAVLEQMGSQFPL